MHSSLHFLQWTTSTQRYKMPYLSAEGNCLLQSQASNTANVKWPLLKQSKWYLTIFLLSVTQFPILLSLACPSKWSNALAHPRPSLSISAPRPPSPSPSPATTTTTTIAADDDDDSVPGIDSHRYDVLKIDDTTRAL